MRYSKQREVILQFVKDSCLHPTADMVYDGVSKVIPNISLGTVYRNLNTLVELGLIQKIVNPNGNDRFDKTLTNHYHINCVKCNKVFDVSEDKVKIINQKIEDETKYKIISHNLFFEGICHKCH